MEDNDLKVQIVKDKKLKNKIIIELPKIQKNRSKQNYINFPYSVEYLLKDMKGILSPLLRKRNLVEKWSRDIADFCIISNMQAAENPSSCESDDYILNSINRYTFEHIYNDTDSMINRLIGEIFLKTDNYYFDVDSEISNIGYNIFKLWNMCRHVNSWLYDEAEEHESFDYMPIFDTVANTFYEFENKIKSKRENIEKVFIVIEKSNVSRFHYNNKNKVLKLEAVYNDLIDIAYKITKLDVIKKHFILDSIYDLCDSLFIATGKLYMEVEKANRIINELKEFFRVELSLCNSYDNCHFSEQLKECHNDLKKLINEFMVLSV